MECGWNIKLYEAERRQEWDDFVNAARNGTFLFLRGYMDYHADRFSDFSLMAYRGNKLYALLPAHCTEDALCSHCGLTYGGMVTNEKMTAALMLQLFECVIKFVRSRTSVRKWLYKPLPYIYARYPSGEDLYALYRFGARLSERKISTVIPSGGGVSFSELRRRKVRHAVREEYTVSEEDDYAAFWDILEHNLKHRHQASPVHSLEEITLLQRTFPLHIRLYGVRSKDGRMLAGCVMYVTGRVAHAQYIASTPEGREGGAVDLLFSHLIREVYSDMPYFDLGTSVEEGGQVLNEGLIFQKEGFGGRAVMYDTYEMEF